MPKIPLNGNEAAIYASQIHPKEVHMFLAQTFLGKKPPFPSPHHHDHHFYAG